MSTINKRRIFWGLFVFFIFYSIIVDTIGSDEDKGKAFLTEEAKEGKLLYQEYNCGACHQLYGLGGFMGPDITNVISEEGKGELYTKAFLQAGTLKMPNFHLDEKEVLALIAYLKYVDKTGYSPVKEFRTNWDGTVEAMKKDY